MNASSRTCPHAFRFIVSTAIVEIPDEAPLFDDAAALGAMDVGPARAFGPPDPLTRPATSQPVLHVGAGADDSFFVRCVLQRAGISNPVVEIKDGSELCDYHTVAMLQNELPAVVLLYLDALVPEEADILTWVRQRQDLDPVVVVAVAAAEATPVRTGETFDLHIAPGALEAALPVLLWSVSRAG